MVAGAPRFRSLPPKDMIKLGEEMIEWVKKNNPLHLTAWYAIEKDFTDLQWEAFQQAPEFYPYYRKALKMIGMQYLDKNSDVREGISQRWQRVYFKDLRKQEDEDLQTKLDKELENKKKIIEHEALIAKQNTTGISIDILEKFDDFMKSLSDAQSSRKIDNINNKQADKS